jgi:hypothetical protein
MLRRSGIRNLFGIVTACPDGASSSQVAWDASEVAERSSSWQVDTRLTVASPQNGLPEQDLEPSSRRWLGLPVLRCKGADLSTVRKALPQFGRQPFTMASPDGTELGFNPYLDMIYRLPTVQGDRPIPVGVVSKDYRLVDHHYVLRCIEEALLDSDIDINKLRVDSEWTINAERARFSFLLPDDERFTFAVAASDQMRFRIEVFNSVDGSCRFMAVAGWLRFVCLNGLVLGTALMRMRRQHRQELEIETLGGALTDALAAAKQDRETMADWKEQDLNPDALAAWVDKPVYEKLGLKAAVRVHAITSTGFDTELPRNAKTKVPSQIQTEKGLKVPGMDGFTSTVFGASQALTWLAGQRKELNEDLEWRFLVPELIEILQGLRERQCRSSF